jgi:hypothetical protein
MRRLEKRLFKLGDEIAALRAEQNLAREELVYHQHLNDDAQRDAAGGSELDRADARETAADVARTEAHIEDLERKIRDKEARRDQLIERLG